MPLRATHSIDIESGVPVIPVSPKTIAPGKRPSFDIFDHQGALLLLRGALITSEAQAEQLRKNGYRQPEVPASVSVFDEVTTLAGRLTGMLRDLAEDRKDINWNRRIHHFAEDFVRISDLDPDAAFANIHLDIRHSYLVVHSMMAAMVSARLALAMNLDRAQRLSLTGAALTHDFGLVPMRLDLNGDGPLSEVHREQIRRHAIDTVQMLQGFGIDDPLWLEAVRDHHEYLDGSGYTGKSGEDLSLGARILSLADTYSAMLRPRPYRERVMASEALEMLYTDEFERYDRKLLETLIWDFGFFPPGSLLRLTSGAMAIAVRNTPGLLDSPEVAVLTDSVGRPLLKPVYRTSCDREHSIMRTLDPSMAARVGRRASQCWSPALREGAS